MRTACPSCAAILNVPDGSEGKKARCVKCNEPFVIAAQATPAAEPARPRRSEMLQQEPARRPAPRVDDDVEEVQPVKPRRRPAPEERPVGGLPVGLLIGGGVGALFLLLLTCSGIGWFVFSSSSTPAPQPVVVAAAPVQPAAPAVPGVPIVVPAVPGMPVVPPAAGEAVALAAAGDGNGNEVFIDLPERDAEGEHRPGFADAPPVGPRGSVVLSNGRVLRARGRAGTVFQIDYRFQGAPPADAVRYLWLIRTARAKFISHTIPAQGMRPQGTLQIRVLGVSRIDGPFKSFLAVDRSTPGRSVDPELISDIVTIH